MNPKALLAPADQVIAAIGGSEIAQHLGHCADGGEMARLRRLHIRIGLQKHADRALGLTSKVSRSYALTLKVSGFTLRPSGRMNPGGKAGASWTWAGTQRSGIILSA